MEDLIKDMWSGDTNNKYHALGKIYRMMSKFSNKKEKDANGNLVDKEISKDSRKMLKGFYTANTLEIDPNRGNYWKKCTQEAYDNSMKLYDELFDKDKT